MKKKEVVKQSKTGFPIYFSPVSLSEYDNYKDFISHWYEVADEIDNGIATAILIYREHQVIKNYKKIGNRTTLLSVTKEKWNDRYGWEVYYYERFN